MQDANLSNSLRNTTTEAKGLLTVLNDIKNRAKPADGERTFFDGLGDAAKNFKGSLTDVVNQASLFDDAVIKASRTLGQSVVFARELEDRFADVSETIVKIGGDIDDVVDIFKSMSAAMERTVFFSNQALTNMAFLQKAGVTDAAIQSFNKLFDAIGGTYEMAGEQQMDLVNQAKTYGLNVASFMTSVAGQLTKINQFGFPNGVQDLAEMVAKSKQLGNNIEATAQFADKIMGDPEKAFDLAAKFQTIGGSFSSLADPMELLYLAQNDLAGLNDKLIESTRGLASFNEQTGQFEVSVQDRLRIKSVAAEFGGDASKIIETATKLAKQEQIVKQLDLTPNFRGISDENKRILASYAQIGKGGKIEIEGKGLEEFQTAGAVNDVLKKIQGKSSQFTDNIDENVAMFQDQASSIEQVKISTNVFDKGLTLATIQTEGFAKNLDIVSGTLSGLGGQLAGLKKKIGEGAIDYLTVLKAGAVAGVEGVLPAGTTEGTSKRTTIETEKPIEVSLKTNFQFSDIVKGELKTIVQSAVTTAITNSMGGGIKKPDSGPKVGETETE
jgi:hypothetical protein